MAEIKGQEPAPQAGSEKEIVAGAERDESIDLASIAEDQVVPWSDAALTLPRRKLQHTHTSFPLQMVFEEARELLERTGHAGVYGPTLKEGELIHRLSDCIHELDGTLFKAFTLGRMARDADLDLVALDKWRERFLQNIRKSLLIIHRTDEEIEATLQTRSERILLGEEIFEQSVLRSKELDRALELIDGYERRVAKRLAIDAAEADARGMPTTETTAQQTERRGLLKRFRLWRKPEPVTELPSQERESFDVKWSGPRSYPEIVEHANALGGRAKRLGGDFSEVRFFGTKRAQAAAFESAATRTFYRAELANKLKEVRVVPYLGELPGGDSKREITAFSVDTEGRLLLSEAAFANVHVLQSTVAEVSLFEGDQLSVNYQDRNRTMLAIQRLKEDSVLSEADLQARNGYLKSRGIKIPILGRDMQIRGSVYVGGYDRASLRIDQSPLIRRLADEFWTSRIAKLPEDPHRTARRLLRYVQSALPYDSSIEDRITRFTEDWQYIDKKEPLSFDVLFQLPQPGYPRDIDYANYHLAHYPKRPGGVCSHQAVFAGLILERGIELGLIEGTVSVDRNSTQRGAHAYTLWEPEPNKPIIVDPAQDYAGSIRGGMWPYIRESHAKLLRENPIPFGARFDFSYSDPQ